MHTEFKFEDLPKYNKSLSNYASKKEEKSGYTPSWGLASDPHS